MNPAEVPAWVAWLAQDADGTWWGYEATPNKQDYGWYENEVGRIVRLGRTPRPEDWEAMLLRIDTAQAREVIAAMPAAADRS